MHSHELDETEFQATFTSPMKDVTSTAEEVVDLWEYADPVLASSFPSSADWEWRVKHIYETPSGELQHLLVPAPTDNTYMVFVINKNSRTIEGHHLLDLGALYGIAKY